MTAGLKTLNLVCIHEASLYSLFISLYMYIAKNSYVNIHAWKAPIGNIHVFISHLWMQKLSQFSIFKELWKIWAWNFVAAQDLVTDWLHVLLEPSLHKILSCSKTDMPYLSFNLICQPKKQMRFKNTLSFLKYAFSSVMKFVLTCEVSLSWIYSLYKLSGLAYLVEHWTVIPEVLVGTPQ